MSNGGAQHKTYGPFWDATNGTIYSQPKLYHYAAGTSNAKDIWANEDKTGALAQPFVAGTDGLFQFYGDGDYKFVIKSSADVTLHTWDNVKLTSDTATLWEGNYGTSLPSATVNNLGHLFAELEDTTNDFEKLWINHGTGVGGAGPAFLKLLEWDGTYFIFDNILTKSPIVNVLAYGAIGGDGSTDDSTAIQNAANAIPANGGVLWFPRGTYKMTTDIDIADKPIHIMGDGINQSIIKWVSGSDYGIDYESSNVRDTLIVSDLTLHTEVTGSGDAINANWATGGLSRTNCIIRDVEIAPTVAAAGTAYFNNGIILSDSSNCEIRNATIIGQSTGSPLMTAAIHITDASLKTSVISCNIWYALTGVLMEGTCDRSIIAKNTMTNVSKGVSYNFATAEDANICISNNINSFLWGIHCAKVKESIIANNRLMANTTSTDNYLGITIDSNSLEVSVIGNFISETTGNTDVGITLNGDDCLVEGNYIKDMTTGITALAASNTNFITGNRSIDNTTDYADAGTGNRWTNNYQEGIISLAAAAPTTTVPSVGDMFQMTNESGSTKSINTLSVRPFGSLVTFYAPIGGEPTDIIWFLDRTGGTGTGNIYLVGSGDQQLNAGDLITMRCDGTNWHEVATIAATG